MSDKILTDIHGRLDALEAVVFGKADIRRGGNANVSDRRLGKREVAVREGRSTRTIDRQVKDGTFPSPDIINGRCFWWLSVLQRHEQARLATAKTMHRGVAGRFAKTSNDATEAR